MFKVNKVQRKLEDRDGEIEKQVEDLSAVPGSRKDKSARQWENEDNICPSINWGT